MVAHGSKYHSLMSSCQQHARLLLFNSTASKTRLRSTLIRFGRRTRKPASQIDSTSTDFKASPASECYFSFRRKHSKFNSLDASVALPFARRRFELRDTISQVLTHFHCEYIIALRAYKICHLIRRFVSAHHRSRRFNCVTSPTPLGKRTARSFALPPRLLTRSAADQ